MRQNATDSPLFSVVVPSLNQGRYLGIALESLFAQKADDLEIIVVDGGSTDESVETIKKSADQIAWWCSEPDRGQSEALNKGFARAKGRFLFWLNADDLLLPGALDAVRRYVQGHPDAEWIAGDLRYIDQNGRCLRRFRACPWRDFLFRGYPVRVPGPSSFFTRVLWNRSGGRFDETLRYMMDTDLWQRFKESGARYQLAGAELFAFRYHAGSKTSSDLAGRPAEAIRAERGVLVRRYGLRHMAWGAWRFRLWRLLCGAYWPSLRARKTRGEGKGSGR